MNKMHAKSKGKGNQIRKMGVYNGSRVPDLQCGIFVDTPWSEMCGGWGWTSR